MRQAESGAQAWSLRVGLYFVPLVKRGMPIDAFEPHRIVRLLGKPAADFTGGDLVRAIEQLRLRQVNLRYVGGDGRLKTSAFAINSREHLFEVLTRGERVDGSSVFAGTSTDDSDVYVVPRHRTAFLNPFLNPFGLRTRRERKRWISGWLVVWLGVHSRVS